MEMGPSTNQKLPVHFLQLVKTLQNKKLILFSRLLMWIEMVKWTMKSLLHLCAHLPQRFDRNGDGALETSELAAALKSSGESYSDVEVNAIFNLGDSDGVVKLLMRNSLLL